MKLSTFLIVFLLLSQFVWATFDIPTQLSDKDERDILKNIGPGTAARLLSAPFPLGGFEGLEVGLSRQAIPLDNLQHLGNGTEPQSELSYPILTIGKGLFNNIDMFLSLIPFAQSSSLTHFSSQVRIQHWSSLTSPFIISSAWHAGYSTLKNEINFQNYGFDVLGTFYFRTACLYFGVGTLFSNGRFIGGVDGITKSQDTDIVTATFAHRVLGFDYRINEYFIALETDSYDKPFYSVKLGYRF